MRARLIITFLSIFSSTKTIGISTAQQSENSLNGKHINVIWPLWEGNPVKLWGPLKGGVVLDYLSSRFNFTYSMVEVRELLLQSSGKQRGLFDYLLEQKCDLLIQDVTPTSKRMELVDLTTPWVYGYMAFLIPVPDNKANINAIIKPFQWPIWISILCSIVFVLFTLNLLQRFLGKFSGSETVNSSIEMSSAELRNNPGADGSHSAVASRNKKRINYLNVIGILLSQGQHFSPTRLPFRVVAGTWALVAFVIVQSYTSLLFTYIMTPNNPPLINSIYDLADKNDVNLFIRKGIILDLLLTNTSEVEVNRKLGKKLDSLPNSRCNYPSQCFSMITPGSKNVFLDSISFQLDAIREIFEKTGKCSVQLAPIYKDGLKSSIVATFALQKNSPYTKEVNKGIMELREIGLIDYWDSWFRPIPPQCANNIKMDHKSTTKGADKIAPITLNNLFSAFVVLALGCSLSLLVFLCEKIWFGFRR